MLHVTRAEETIILEFCAARMPIPSTIKLKNGDTHMQANLKTHVHSEATCVHDGALLVYEFIMSLNHLLSLV